MDLKTFGMKTKIDWTVKNFVPPESPRHEFLPLAFTQIWCSSTCWVVPTANSLTHCSAVITLIWAWYKCLLSGRFGTIPYPVIVPSVPILGLSPRSARLTSCTLSLSVTSLISSSKPTPWKDLPPSYLYFGWINTVLTEYILPPVRSLLFVPTLTETFLAL